MKHPVMPLSCQSAKQTEGNHGLISQTDAARAAGLSAHQQLQAVRVNVTSIVEGEYAENEVRKDFTASERVAIAEVVRISMGERRGRPTENSEKIHELEGGRSADIAAKKAGFGNENTFRQARAVVNNGTPELVQAMDSDRKN